MLTGLKNRLMPLIRYRTGDLAALDRDERGLALSALNGRVHDLVSIGGKIYPSHYVQDLLQRIGGIAEFQIETGGDRRSCDWCWSTGRAAEEVRTRIADWWGEQYDCRICRARGVEVDGKPGEVPACCREQAGMSYRAP